MANNKTIEELNSRLEELINTSNYILTPYEIEQKGIEIEQLEKQIEMT